MILQHSNVENNHMHLRTQDKSNKQQYVYIHLQQKKGPHFPMEFDLTLKER